MSLISKFSVTKFRDDIICLCRTDSCVWSVWLKSISPTRKIATRYILVGLIGAIIEMILFTYLFRLGFGIVTSNVVAFHLAFIACYFLHYYYTHRKPFKGKLVVANGLGKYATLMYGQLIVGSVLLWVLIKIFGWNADLSKILQIAIVTPGSYAIQKVFIFERKPIK